MLHPRGVYRVLLICRIILLLLRIQGVGGWGQLVTTQDAVGASASKLLYGTWERTHIFSESSYTSYN